LPVLFLNVHGHFCSLFFFGIGQQPALADQSRRTENLQFADGGLAQAFQAGRNKTFRCHFAPRRGLRADTLPILFYNAVDCIAFP
ncbi:hypothetical protein B0H14DRAFT_2717793, partial [Mycena olivaceomarginata]